MPRWTVFSDDGRHGPARDLTDAQKAEVMSIVMDPNAINREDAINLAVRAGMIDDQNALTVEGEWVSDDTLETPTRSGWWPFGR